VGGPALTGGVAAAVWFAWAVRGRSSSVFASSVWRGPKNRRAIALTFDDGPTRGTATLLNVLARHNVQATFFQCGAQVRRHNAIAREVAAAQHEIGNHSDTHPRLWLRSRAFLRDEALRAQTSIAEVTGQTPRYFRAPYGVRWPGLGAVQREFGLTGVMWTTIGRDWTLDGNATARRLIAGAQPGAILCLHDGRELAPLPDITATVRAVEMFLPVLIQQGWHFVTVSDLLSGTTDR
jgi:peptidoglycan/xylan/chitin deacetylase (PgdA/CDA1 family)